MKYDYQTSARYRCIARSAISAQVQRQNLGAGTSDSVNGVALCRNSVLDMYNDSHSIGIPFTST